MSPTGGSHPTTPKFLHVILKIASFSVIKHYFVGPLAYRINTSAVASWSLTDLCAEYPLASIDNFRSSAYSISH